MSTWEELSEKHSPIVWLPTRETWHTCRCRYYVHIPKTGGKMFRSHGTPDFGSRGFEFSRKHVWDPRVTYPKQGASYFSTVRNPYDWLISMWFYDWGEKAGAGPQDTYPSLEHFLYDFNSPKLTGKNQWDTRELGATKHIMWPLRYFQLAQTFDPFDSPGRKESFASFYIRLERIDSFFRDAWSWTSKSKPPKTNTSKHNDYRTYYTPDLVDHIANWRGQELSLMGYDFDGPKGPEVTFSIRGSYYYQLE